ncbi:hypothetical protein V6Z11_A07G251500 [Gossypium hirsutum]
MLEWKRLLKLLKLPMPITSFLSCLKDMTPRLAKEGFKCLVDRNNELL